MAAPLTFRAAYATCRDEAPLPEDLRLRIRQGGGPNAVLAAAQDRLAAKGWPIGAECISVRDFFMTLGRFAAQHDGPTIGLSCGADGLHAPEPFKTGEAGGGAVLVDREPGPVRLRTLQHDNTKDIGGMLRASFGDFLPDLTLAGLPVQSNARREVVGAVPSALHSYLPWSGTHDAHIVPGLAIAAAALRDEIPAKALRLPEAPKSIAVIASQGRSFVGLCILERS